MEAITAPLDLTYNSYEEAYLALKTHGMEHGYGFVLKRSKPHNACDRVPLKVSYL
ncbi:hypothetical protein PSPO01_15514 [Paraphaeosphaeria sporulosa]